MEDIFEEAKALEDRVEELEEENSRIRLSLHDSEDAFGAFRQECAKKTVEKNKPRTVFVCSDSRLSASRYAHDYRVVKWTLLENGHLLRGLRYSDCIVVFYGDYKKNEQYEDIMQVALSQDLEIITI